MVTPLPFMALLRFLIVSYRVVFCLQAELLLLRIKLFLVRIAIVRVEELGAHIHRLLGDASKSLIARVVLRLDLVELRGGRVGLCRTAASHK